MNSTSGFLKLNNIDFKKIGKGLLIALSGAFTTYLAETIPGIDFGSFSPVIMALFSMVINAINKLLTNYSISGQIEDDRV